VFPDTRRQAFLLPVKTQVRTEAGIEDGDHVAVALDIADA
jgi:SOS-response transcriptional repressor LexA